MVNNNEGVPTWCSRGPRYDSSGKLGRYPPCHPVPKTGNHFCHFDLQPLRCPTTESCQELRSILMTVSRS